MQRFGTALLLPLSVFPLAVATALSVGWLLHQVPRFVVAGAFEIPIPPLIALAFTLAITSAGFYAAYGRGGD